MDFIDYGRSFVTTSADFNSPRFWIESRCRIVGKDGEIEDYCQGASCKSEHTFAEKDLFHEDNYDFLPVFSDRYCVVFRRNAYLNENYRTVRAVREMWGEPTFRLVKPATVRVLETTADVREATHAGSPIVSRTEIANKDTGMRAVIECPIKTMNINDESDLYQVDTGPVVFPDLTRTREPGPHAISLAFIAFNAPHFADFVIERPTPVLRDGEEVCRVHHYSGRVSLPAANTLYAVE